VFYEYLFVLGATTSLGVYRILVEATIFFGIYRNPSALRSQSSPIEPVSVLRRGTTVEPLFVFLSKDATYNECRSNTSKPLRKLGVQVKHLKTFEKMGSRVGVQVKHLKTFEKMDSRVGVQVKHLKTFEKMGSRVGVQVKHLKTFEKMECRLHMRPYH
jgi:hypothetical protein